MEIFSQLNKRNRENVDGSGSSSTPKKHTYEDVIKKHPFVDLAEYDVLLKDDVTLTDSNGKVVCHVLRQAYPAAVADIGTLALRDAATRTSLRALIFGGVAPRSGIAGYYDYFGSPIEFKCRRTSFTDENIEKWANVFPLVEYVNEIYKQLAPTQWDAQNAAIPDLVRIRGTAFSTLTINERFRTAKHTDAGDFDDGMGCITVLDGKFDGLHLGFPDFGVCVELRPRDVMLFNTHHFHCNTEVEVDESWMATWSRLSVVFYYRANLGSTHCHEQYERRLKNLLKKDPKAAHTKLSPITNSQGCNKANRQEDVHTDGIRTPALAFIAWARRHENAPSFLRSFVCLNDWFQANASMWKRCEPALPPRDPDELICPLSQMEDSIPRTLTGFSETHYSEDTPDVFEGLPSWKLPKDLYTMWVESREQWLSRVRTDWNIQSLRRSNGNFTWANKGEVNRTFFDLCDVATGVMRFLLAENAQVGEDVLPAQKTSFFGAFAVHLFHSCIRELNMPPNAMTLRKLNVKIKDYEFGGTRYFKDLPPEEKQRRQARKERIEVARLSRDPGRSNDTNEWLQNDSYDYQKEDVAPDYRKLKIPTPQQFLKQRISAQYLPNCTPLKKLSHDAQKELSTTSVAVISMLGMESVRDATSRADMESKFPSAFQDLTADAKREYNRILDTFIMQQNSLNTNNKTWQSTKHTDCRVISAHDVLRLGVEEPIVVVLWALHVMDESLIRVLCKAGKYAIFAIRNTRDPRHYLLKPRVREAVGEAMPWALRLALGPSHSPSSLLPTGISIRGCCEVIASCGYTVIGVYQSRGSAFGDLWIACAPNNKSTT